MKANMSYQKKRTLIIIAIIAVLAIAATIGTVVYINGNRRAAAATPEGVTDYVPDTQSGNGGETPGILPGLGDDTTPQTNPNEGTTIPAVPNDANTPVNNAGNNAGNNNNGATPANNGTVNNGAANNGGNGTRRTTTTANGTANIPNQQYTQTTVIPEGGDTVLVSETDTRTWVPVGSGRLAVNSNVETEFGTNIPNLVANKSAYMQGDDSRQDNAIQVGEQIEYVISIQNNGTAPASNIYVYDRIPEGTKLVDGQNLRDNNGTISWKIDTINENEIVSVSFKVEVEEITENGIINTAIINGEESNTAATPVITTGKTAQVIDLDGNIVTTNRAAKVGEKIRYTITVTNNSSVEGQVTVKDTIPEGTKLAGNIMMANETLTEESLAEGVKVDLAAKEEKTIIFDVEVLDATNAIKNAATIGNTKTEEQSTSVANIKTKKESKGSSEQLHEADTITYTLTSTNTGDADGIVKIADKVPVGTSLVGDIQVEDEDGTRTIENISAEEAIENGIDVKVAANGGVATVKFTVVINSFAEGDEGVTVNPETKAVSRKIVNAEATQDGVNIIEQDPENPEEKTTEDGIEKEFVTITVDKTWTEPEGLGTSYRPDVQFEIYDASGAKIKSESYNGEPVVFSNLPKYVDDTLVVYTVKEVTTYPGTVEYYKTAEEKTVSIDENNVGSVTIENVFDETTVNETAVSITKEWIDNSNAEGLRPETNGVTFTLKADGETTNAQARIVDNGDDTWTISFNGLQTYSNQKAIEYIVEEGIVENYTTTNNTAIDQGTITNTLDWSKITTDDTHKLTIIKKWEDAETETSTAGAGYKLVDLWADSHLFGNGLGNTLSENAREAIKLYLEDKTGHEIKLGLTYRMHGLNLERVIYSYKREIKIFGIPTTITETRMVFLPRYIVVKGADSSLEVETMRPDSIKVNVLPEGTVTLANTTATVDLTAGDNWQKTVNGLRVYDDEGNKITYKVEETVPEGYECIKPIEKVTRGNDTTYTITNKAIEESNEKTDIVVNKNWNDNDNAEGLRPESIEVTLYANGKITDPKQTLTLKASEGWVGKFANLPVLDENKEIISYTVVEEEIENYTSEIEVITPRETPDANVIPEIIYNITNTLKWSEINTTNTVKVTKNWEEPKELGESYRPSVSFTLTTTDIANFQPVTKRLTDDTKFEDLRKYNDEGKIITYNITETVDNETYYTKDSEAKTATFEDKNEEMVTFTNTFKPESIKDTAVSITKEWIDNNNAEGLRPETNGVTFTLKADGEATNAQARIADNRNGKWTVSFNGLQTYNAQKKIEYTVEEGTVANYTTSNNTAIDQGTITNTLDITATSLNQEKISITKVWNDNSDARKLRTDATFTLYKKVGNQDAVATDKTETIKEDGPVEFKDLPKYELVNGVVTPVTYTVRETPINDYVTTYANADGSDVTSKGEVGNNGVITNTLYVPNIKVNKIGTKNGEPISATNTVKYGDVITYTITAENSGAAGTVTITDAKLGELVKAKVVEYNENASLAQELVDGKTVNVPENDSVTFTFSVTVIATTPGTEVKNTITVEGGENISEDNPPTTTIEQNITTITKSERIEGAHIVIAMDRSYSMETIPERDDNECTDSNCTKEHYIQKELRNWKMVDVKYHTKLSREKDAVINLINQIYPNSSADNNHTEVTVIAYCDAVQTYTVGSATTYATAQTLKREIGKVEPFGATNFTKCLSKIDDKLTTNNKDDNYVIIIGDGSSFSIADWNIWGALDKNIKNIKNKANVFTIGLDASGNAKTRLQELVSGIGTYTDSTASTDAITSAIESIRRVIINNGNPQQGKTQKGILTLDPRAYADENHPVIVKINGEIHKTYTSLSGNTIDFTSETIPANATVEVSYFIQ